MLIVYEKKKQIISNLWHDVIVGLVYVPYNVLSKCLLCRFWR